MEIRARMCLSADGFVGRPEDAVADAGTAGVP